MKIVLVGATGLVGGVVLDQLLNHLDGPEVAVLARRATGKAHLKMTEHIAPAADWPSIIATLSANIAISTLGTTLKVAGSRAAFEAVDLETVVSFAKAARTAGASQMLMVSSVGAKATSGNFYLRTKGRADAAVADLGFQRLDIFRPGLLRGPRNVVRPAERLGQIVQSVLDPLLLGGFSKYRSIQAHDVACAVVACTALQAAGTFYRHNEDMWRIAK